jgi:hypothetical protein
MRKFLGGVVLAVVFAGVAASAASATIGPAMLNSRAPIGTGSNTATVAGFPASAGNLGASVFTTASGAHVDCQEVDFKITNLTTTTAHFDASYSLCTATVPPLTFSATVHVGCQWTLTFQNATFNNTTGAGANATVDLPCNTTVTVPAAGCQITVASQTRGHITTQNLDSAGAPTTSGPSPTGVKLTPNVSGLSYTSNCIGVPTPGTASYIGPVYVHNVWGSL